MLVTIGLFIATANVSPAGAPTAKSSENWYCLQDAYGGGPPVTLHFVVDGSTLKEGPVEWPFSIVHNSATEIIATYPSVGIAGGKRVVNARTVVIDKITGDMVASNVDLWATADENSPSIGRCSPGR